MRNKYHCAVIDMIAEKTMFEFDTTTLKGLTLDDVVERMKANGADVKVNWGINFLSIRTAIITALSICEFIKAAEFSQCPCKRGRTCSILYIRKGY